MSSIRRIAMFSVHGYFDPEPVLGRTDTGGQVTYVLELAKHLARLGVAVDIYTRRFGGREEIAPVADDVRVIRIAAAGDDFIRKEDLFPHLDELTTNTREFMEREGLTYDLLHGHYWDAGYVCLQLADALKLPFIFTAHSLGAWKKEQMGGDPAEMEKLFNFEQRIKWEHRIFDGADGQTVTTIDGVETYKRLYQFESDDMIVIPPGVDIERFRPADEGEKRPADMPERFVFALSRIDSNKGIDFLIRGFGEIAADVDAHLVVGGGSKEPKAHEAEVKQGLIAIVDELDLRDRVRFTGYLPDDKRDEYYRHAAVFVLPSKYEPFGMTVLEAMACRTPVVATGLGGLRHVLHNEEDSLLVDPSDKVQLGTAIGRVLNDPAVSDRIAENGLRLVHDKFSWQSIAARSLSFFERYV